MSGIDPREYLRLDIELSEARELISFLQEELERSNETLHRLAENFDEAFVEARRLRLSRTRRANEARQRKHRRLVGHARRLRGEGKTHSDIAAALKRSPRQVYRLLEDDGTTKRQDMTT